MIHLQRSLGFPVAFIAAAFMAGCGGGLDPILGNPDVGTVPTVVTTSPAASTPIATGVALNSSVSVTFSEAMAPATINATNFSVACPAGTPVAATVAYNTTTHTATLVPNVALPPNTICVATVTTGAQNSRGIPLASNVVWSFTTSATADTTRPTVTLTVPAPSAVGAATNSKLSATFSESMLASSITGTSFTVRNTTLGAAVAGTVIYSTASRTATFTAAAPGTLAASSAFTVTITTAATDLAGNALAGNTATLPNAGNHVWSFTTGAGTDSTAPTVTAVAPADLSIGNCLSKLVTATFSEAMDPATITAANFTVTDGGTAVAGTVSYDAVNRMASFVPTAPAGFTANRAFIVNVRGGVTGVMDLAGNALAIDRTWTFSTGTQACTSGVNLRTAAAFGGFGGNAGVTNQGINTVVNGNLGTTAACTLITGFHDAANPYTETTLNIGAVNGAIYCGPPAPGTTTTLAIATQARADATTAYNDLAALPAGSDPGAGQLGGLVLPPATYTSAGGTFAITSGNLTLDAQGDPNAVWVFQAASSLTIGQTATPRTVSLINGAQARNVFWRVGSAARIEDGSTMVGTIIAAAGVTISTPGQTIQTTLVGRAIGLNASVTMVNTTVVAP